MLVVVGVIAVLVGILLPTLATARKQSRRVLCMNNQRQLAVAWLLYSNEFAGYLPLGYPDGGSASASPNDRIDPKFIPWVIGDARESGAKRYVLLGASGGADWLIRAGSVYRYLRNVSVYRCPEHDPQYGVDEINISYAINNYLNGAGAPNPKLLRRTQVRKPAVTYLSIDQLDMSEWPSEGDEKSGIMYADWAGWFTAPPAPRHQGGSCLSFVDGHAIWIKWVRADLWASFPRHASSANNATNADADMKTLRSVSGY